MNGGTTLTLATVTFISASMDNGSAKLEAEAITPEAITPEASNSSEHEVVEHVYRHHPDGVVTHTQTRTPAGRKHYRMEPELPAVRYADVVGVWQRITHRPLG